LLIRGFIFLFYFSWRAQASFQPVPLALPLDNFTDIQSYYVSEKYDGVRAYWDGSSLYSRQGKKIVLPKNFTKHWPQETLDGELWLGRGRFSQLMSLLQRKDKTDKKWQEVTYMVFDAPDVKGTLMARQVFLKSLLSEHLGAHLQWVEQKVFANEHTLKVWYQTLLGQDAEGIILRKKDSLYISGRDANYRKYKPYQVGKAQVIGYQPGRGKFKGMVGSLILKELNGVVFQAGSGLTDKQRRQPPLIGAWVLFRYQGRGTQRRPRFPVYQALVVRN
jgi:DNA ligase-1